MEQIDGFVRRHSFIDQRDRQVEPAFQLSCKAAGERGQGMRTVIHVQRKSDYEKDRLPFVDEPRNGSEAAPRLSCIDGCKWMRERQSGLADRNTDPLLPEIKRENGSTAGSWNIRCGRHVA